MLASVRRPTAIAFVAASLSLGAARDAAAQGNPACALLTTEEIRAASGRAYKDGTPGDELGDGAGGGASCQWDLGPGGELPLLSLVFIPPRKGGSYTESTLERKPMQGCTRETLSGVGDVAYVELCEKARGPVVYARAGRNDVLVQLDPERGKPLSSAKAAAIAVARAAAAKARAK